MASKKTRRKKKRMGPANVTNIYCFIEANVAGRGVSGVWCEYVKSGRIDNGRGNRVEIKGETRRDVS